MNRRLARCAAVALGLGVAAFAAVSQDKAQAERIKRVEAGLLPSLLTQRTLPMPLAERMKFYGVPGVSVAVIDGGRLVWAKGYGVRQLGGNEPVTAETMFQAGSISKPVSAIAALKLVQQGELSLDGDVNDKLKGWKLPASALTETNKVTLRRILSHSAGLTVSGFMGYTAGEAVPTLVQLLDGVAPANSPAVRVDIAPNTQVRYSGGGYQVLQQLMSDVSGSAMAPLMQRLVLAPAGMSHSTFEQPLPAARRSLAAAGHSRDKVLAGSANTHPEQAAAGLWTTPSDLARLVLDVQAAHAGKTGLLLTPAMAREMLTPQLGVVGLGFFLAGSGATRTFGHGGVNAGFESSLVAYSQAGRGAIVMTNAQGGSRLADEVMRAVAAEYGWEDYLPPRREVIDVSSVQLKRYVGFYERGPDHKAWVQLRDGKLYGRFGARPWAQLYAASEQRFFIEDPSVEIEFSQPGGPRVLTLKERGTSVALARTQESLPPFATVPVFLRGTMNDWGTSMPMTPEGLDRFVITLNLPEGAHEFKVGSADWGAIDFGGGPGQRRLVSGRPAVLVGAGANLQMHTPRAGRWRIVLDVRAPTAPSVTVQALN
jgi:CubicO group peptidase (beta-lactamase class C family)